MVLRPVWYGSISIGECDLKKLFGNKYFIGAKHRAKFFKGKSLGQSEVSVIMLVQRENLAGVWQPTVREVRRWHINPTIGEIQSWCLGKEVRTL